jgi:predicted CopG family antitoxin
MSIRKEKGVEMENKTVSLTEEAYKILVEEKKDNESFADVITRLSKRGKLKDCFGAWDMDDDEEKDMFANLRRFWKQRELRGAKL